MNRKVLALAIALMMVLVTFPPLPAAAETQTDLSDQVVYEYDTAAKTAVVSGFSGSNTEKHDSSYKGVVTIPQTVTKDGEEYTVTAVGDRAFENIRSITDVQLPATVTSIGKNAFNCCANLKTAVIPDGLEAIGQNAFFSCVRLETVQVKSEGADPESSEDDTITEANVITLPASIKNLGAGAFYGCQAASKIDIKGQLTLGDDADNEGHYAFSNCISLKEVVFEESPSKIARQMFARSTALEIVVFPDVDSDTDGPAAIETRAFDACNGLSTFKDDDSADGVLDIPDTVTEIHDKAFNECFGISQAEIPASTIGKQVFMYCSSMDDVIFEEPNQALSAAASAHIGFEAFNGSGYDIHTEGQQDGVFQLPANITKLEAGAFRGANVTHFALADSHTTFAAEDGVLLNKSKDTILAYPGKKSGDYWIPENVTAIGDYAFSRAVVSGVRFPATSSVEAIGANAFNGCYNLTEMGLPDTVTTMGESAFALCDGLTQVIMSKGLTVVEENMFSDCISLTSITIPEGVTEIQDYAFTGCYSLEDVKIPASMTKISPKAFNDCVSLTALDINENNNSFTVEEAVLYNKDKTQLILCLPGNPATSFEIPASINKVGDYAFGNVSAMKAITVESDAAELGTCSIGFSAIYGGGGYDRNNEFYMIVPSADGSAAAYAKANDIAYFTEEPFINMDQVTLEGGESFQLEITGAAEGSILYTSSDESIATVDRRGGLITGVSKGTTYIVANLGTMNFVCQVEVTSGEKPAVTDGVEYKLLGSDTLDAIAEWENDYNNVKNAGVSTEAIDNVNLLEYTSNNYIAIWAKTLSSPAEPRYIYEANEMFGEGGYEEYVNISDNMSLEMSRYKLNENLVLFSGTDDVSQYTIGKTSRMDDMFASRGEIFKAGNQEGEQRYTDDWVTSTSIDQAAAFFFGTGSTKTMLEIYAPADITSGAYLNTFSSFDNEKEILLDGGTSFKVLDAGVRYVEIPSIYGEPIYDMQRYLKLQIVGVNGVPIKEYGTPVIIKAECDPPLDPDEDLNYKVIISETVEPTPEMIEFLGITTDTEIKSMLYSYLIDIIGGAAFAGGSTIVWDVSLEDEDGNLVPSYALPARGVKITLPYPEEVKKNWEDYDFTIVHMFGESGMNTDVGQLEGPIPYNKTDDGLEIVVTALSPYAIHWTLVADSDDPGSDPGNTDPGSGDTPDGDKEAGTGDDSSMTAPIIVLLAALAAIIGALAARRKK